MGGECCKAYIDLTLDYHKQQWCQDYCCGSSFLGLLDCCSNKLLVAPSGDRTGFCVDYFTKNIWAPIVGFGGLGMLICCIVCYMVCCRRNKNRRKVVVKAQQQPASNVIMMTHGGQFQHPPANQGYGMHPGPANPPRYQALYPSSPGMPATK